MQEPLPHPPIALHSHDLLAVPHIVTEPAAMPRGSFKSYSKLRKSGIKPVRMTLSLLLLSFPGDVLGGNPGFNLAVLGFLVGCAQWGALSCSLPFPVKAESPCLSALGKDLF